jgi:hypothetical protein
VHSSRALAPRDAALSPAQLQRGRRTRVDLVRHWLAHPASLARTGNDTFATRGIGGADRPGLTVLGAGRRADWEPGDLGIADGSGDRVSALALDVAAMRHYDPRDEADVVVVGTGARCARARRTRPRGLRVIAGGRCPSSTPPSTRPTRSTPRRSTGWTSASPGAPTRRRSGRTTPGGVGGSTLHWGAFTPRPTAGQLRLRTETGLGRDWPFDSAELLPSSSAPKRTSV